MTTARGNTVTLTVVQGESSHPTATFSAAMAARQVAVGSGPDSQWKVRAHGVEPVHAELYWDGNILWARDAGSLSGVYVSNERADEWQQIFDASEVLLGSAVLRAKVVGPDARAPAASAPSRATSAAFVDEEESTEVFSNQALSDAIRGGGSIAPPAAPMVNNMAGRPATQAPPRTSIPQIPSLPGAPSPSLASSMSSSMLTPSPVLAASAPPSSPSMAPVSPMGPVTPPPAGGGRSEATVIRPSPYAAMEASSGLTPRAGGGGMHAAIPHDRPDERTVMANPGELLAGLGGAGVAMPMVQPRAMTMAPPLAPGLQPMAPMAPAPTSMSPMGAGLSTGPGFGQPVGAGEGFGDDPFGSMELPPPPKPQGAGLTSMPPRTLALAGILLTLCAVLLMLGPAQHPATPAGPARQQYVVRTMGATPPPTNNILQLPIVTIPQGQPALVGVIVPAPMTPTVTPGRAPVYPAANLQDPIRVAAEAVAANRYADAATLYEQLAAAHPEAPLFRQFATVLRARANQQHCQPGAPGCTPATAVQQPTAPSAAPPAAPPSP